MSGPNRLHDDELVIRCGKPPYDVAKLIRDGCDEHPEGFFGFSVQYAPGAAVESLAAWCPNNTIGWTTVREVRSAGYEIVMTSGRGHHATVEVPRDWRMDAAQALMAVFEAMKNPVPREGRRR